MKNLLPIAVLASMSMKDYAARMQELHEGHAARIAHMERIVRAHQQHNAAFARALMRPRGAILDPLDDVTLRTPAATLVSMISLSTQAPKPSASVHALRRRAA